jgi:hypothetical protein
MGWTGCTQPEAMAKTVELLGVDRTDVETTLEQGLDDRRDKDEETSPRQKTERRSASGRRCAGRP